MKKFTISLVITVLMMSTANRINAQCTYTTAHYDLKAGQFINAGGLMVTNDGVNLTVVYYTNSSWYLKEVQLYVGPASGINLNGNASPGQFPYRKIFNAANVVIEHTQVIPLASLPECFVIAAHAVVKQRCLGLLTETAWAQGTAFGGGNWAMYNNYCKNTCPTP